MVKPTETVLKETKEAVTSEPSDPAVQPTEAETIKSPSGEAEASKPPSGEAEASQPPTGEAKSDNPEDRSEGQGEERVYKEA